MIPLSVALIGGDGIGPEILMNCLEVLHACEERYKGFKLIYTEVEAGASYFKNTGKDMSVPLLSDIKKFDAILMGAMGLPSIRYPDGTEISPHLRIRKKLGLYAGIRPIKSYPNVSSPLSDQRAEKIDLVLVRESTEGLFASIGKSVVESNTVARETMEITREVCERLFDFVFLLARKRKTLGGKGLVTCVDKANVFPAMAFFRKIFAEKAEENLDINVNYVYVDAAALQMVKCPWEFDVLVTENMFGDILSDLGAGIIGGMGFAPCAEIGDKHGLFQPAHGSAPSLAGKNRANPIAMFISAAMMLEWLGETRQIKDCSLAARDIITAIDRVFLRSHVLPYDIGGKTSTSEITDSVIKTFKKL